MDRRDFLRQVMTWSAGIAVARPVFNVGAVLAAEGAAPASPLVAVAKGKQYFDLVAKVLEPLGGMKAFVKEGQRVVVKPNIGWDRTPEQAADTHPDVVKAVVKLALDAGAKSVAVFDRTVNNPQRCYVNSGIQAAVESLKDARARCVFMDNNDYVPVKIESGKSLTEFAFYKGSLGTECDCYINVPIAKHHKLANLTLGLKNAMGVIGGNRGEIHKDLHQRIADLNVVIRPKLTIMDATRILLRNGPTGGNLDDVKVLDTVAASADTVAVDAYATTLFGMQPGEVAATKAAFDMGLGQMDLGKVKVIET